MKLKRHISNSFSLLGLLVLSFIICGFAEGDAEASRAKVDQSIGASGSMVYINIYATNEDREGYYYLVKWEDDGSFQPVAREKCLPNKLNTPILYSFNDVNGSRRSTKYQLIRVGNGSIPEHMGTWMYKPPKKVGGQPDIREMDLEEADMAVFAQP